MWDFFIFRAMQNFAQLLQAPLDDANAIIGDRFPAPRLVVCDQYGSQVSLITYQKNPPKYKKTLY